MKKTSVLQVLKALPTLALVAPMIVGEAHAATTATRAPLKRRPSATTPTTASALAPAPAANTSTTVAPAAAKAFEPGLTMTYWSVYQGPSITAWGSPYQPTGDGYDDVSSPAGFLNRLSLGYKFIPDLTLFGVLEGFAQPMQGYDWTWNDSFLKLAHSNIYSNKGFKFYGDFRLFLPTSRKSQENGLIAGFRISPAVRYAFEGSRWTIGFDSIVRTNMYGLVGSGKQLDLYFGPVTSYQITGNLAWVTQYELYGRHEIEGEPPFINTDGATDIQTGIDWEIASWLDFNPFVQVYPGSFSWSSTSIGAYISGKLF